MSWIRRGTISATVGSKRVTGVGTSWKTNQVQARPGHMLIVELASGASKVVEIGSVISDTELDIVELWSGDALANSQYAIDTALIDSPSEYAQRIAAMFAYYQQQLDTLSALMTADGQVTLTKPDGTTITVPSLSSVLDSVAASQEWFDTNLPLVEQAAGFATEAKAAAQTATTKAAEATTGAATATTKATQASTSETNAKQSETSAATSAQTATSKATIATDAATTATQQATIATDSAASATQSKDAAAASAQTATTKAGEATAGAVTATAKATIAVDAASAAQGHETVSSSAATTATAKAAEAVAAATVATDKSTIATNAAASALDSKTRAEDAAQRAEELVDQVTGGALLKEQNLADLTDKAVARSNLQVPSVVEMQTALGEITLQSLGAASNVVIQPILPSTSAVFEYTDGQLTGMTEQLPGGQKMTTYTYSGGNLSSSSETFSGTLRTTTYQYDTAGVLTGFTVTEEVAP